ncbi:MAG: hypothetical protein UX87_C0037G0016 [Candidatus Amesbacteria bacterium GW2011_GWA1_47_16]|uniref:Ribbon-helix-helix protein CopG domain-containing protein n=5 Tax=Candidatus Amesiibacteriota TaxID=1752730 RepID=A0A1F4ZVV0_9BACT|nr:MAG: hypothetical protein UX87_C0037G0016 [Candidatus Amesbacteria bacterium GW2011_GWA1_47_16]KKU63786.1 MAG: hypothetical protein UX86_C0018G0022 [Candidatus Amesbacteria bacterium GW2011_GWC1_47_15]KKU97433.1 MAG: hypothetical protein UY28_C0021G0020 [Candidatus Amesbacteria bacterium GW2011_GWB1_48_13]OGC98732.1 MAG: hypothetical protein A2701_01430 [Candidatus Amesbacteria bacterium RIFCSPHIGHO2_01_FULL_47_34]OGD01307.1 MAG: hypothetical protein A2972_01275 [Candidatus Amesbacteria bact
MRVFYTASYLGKQKYQKYYDLVRQAIEKSGVELVSPEKGNYKDLLTAADVRRLRDERLIHYEAIRRGIAWSDAAIIEISNEDFQLGHEATLAMQSRKHVLCLSVYEDFSEKIRNRYFHGARYSEYDAEEIVEAFINKAKKEFLGERFNMFLSPSQLDYLGKIAEKEKIGKSEYLRRLIDEDREVRE